MLGHKLAAALAPDFDVYATCRTLKLFPQFVFPESRLLAGVDAERPETVAAAIERVKPQAVINCVGLIKQQAAAKDPVPAITLNALFPHLLARQCEKAGARLVHFGTDCVFSGRKGGYKESDVSDAQDLYGRTKYLGEADYPHAVTLRSSLIGPELETQLGLVGWFISQRGKTVKGFRRAIYTGFPTIEMARIVAKVLREHPAMHGVYQAASAPISKYDLLGLVNKEMGLGITIEPDDALFCDRSLDGSRFTAETGYTAPDWDSLVANMARDAAAYVK